MKHQGIARDPLWYKDALIYQLHVRSFSDSNADGIGDFAGLTTKLDYLRDLGVSAIWVMPFYPSPLKDDGYDIADYYEINPIYGTLEEFKTFLDEAHGRGLRVITELVINHTSDQHAWFQKSRRAMARFAERAGAKVDPASVPASDDLYRDFYVWTRDPTRYKEVRIIFKDFEPSNWTWDPVAQAYYWHRFFSHQPDLNFDNPCVHDEIIRTIDYWCDMGVDGFRLDAIPYLYEREGTSGESLPETHAFIKKLRAHVDEKYGDRVFLAEANQWPEEAVTYFGQGRGDECHMAFHFPVMPRLFMAVRMEDRVPIVDILEQTPALPETAQWAIFLRNHDELTLEMVTDEERDYMYRVYAHETKARINLGIRRRLAPLLGNDRKKIELLNLLLLSLPGTPVIYYGDEIGMGDNIYLGDRNGVRTPMHWSPDKNAGFSRTTPQALQLPIIMDPEYHYEAINVETQQRNPHSLLWWTKRVLALRKKWKAFGRGTIEFLQPKNRKVLAFLRRYEEETILVVANLSRFPQPVELDLSSFSGIRPRELFGRTKFPAIGDTPYLLTLSPHAAFWFSLVRKPDEVQARADIPVVTVERDWAEAVTGAAMSQLEAALPEYLRRQRWFGGRGRDIDAVTLSDSVALNDVFIVLATVHYVGADPETYFLPLSYARPAEVESLRTARLHRLVAELRGGVDGAIYDASIADAFARPMLAAAADNWHQRTSGGEFFARGGTDLSALGGEISMASDFNNTSFAVGGRLFVKLFRRVEAGIHPELELARFFAAHHFPHVPRFNAALEYRRGGEPVDLALVTEFVPNAVSCWEAALDALGRYLDRVRGLPADAVAPNVTDRVIALSETPVPTELTTLLGAFAEVMRLLGQRTGEMHAKLASDPDWPDFAPEPFTPFYQRSVYQSMRNRMVEVLDVLKQSMEGIEDPARALAITVLERQTAMLARFRAIHQSPIDAQRIRVHGDYHLAQVLYTGKDHVIIDLEGEWARPISERRIKRCALHDVVGVIRSIHYVGAVALNREQELGHISPERVATLEPWVRLWTRQMSAVFFRGYQDVISATPILPKNPAHLNVLLDAMLLDRTLAELGHELSNRPRSVHIPLRGLLGLFPSV